MKVLFAVWEMDPFIKIGGLGDVARSLPAALKRRDIDIRVIIPYYDALKLKHYKRTKVARFSCLYNSKKETVEVFLVNHPTSKVPVYLVRNEKYLTLAKFPDTFSFFNKLIIDLLEKNMLLWMPDVIHCNDYHAALIPLLVRERKLPIKTMVTIHNLSYQGITSTEVLTRLGIDESKCRVIHWETKERKINCLMEGIIHADVVTTVSPTYAKEIVTEEYGCGLEDVLSGKAGRVFGILNGIDVFDEWRYMTRRTFIKGQYLLSENQKIPIPEKIMFVPWEEAKRTNKVFLQRKLHLKIDPTLPMISFIGRIDAKQKGIDILHKMLRRIDLEKYTFVILGTGNPDWEERFHWFNKFYPKLVSCVFKFEDILAHQIYAASDFLVVPSLFEPCGLIQMIAMLYGTLPIAHKTGGLADSITDGTNGFLFENYSSEALEKALMRAVNMWHHDKQQYRKMVESAMQKDFSWDKSALEYIDLYNKLLSGEL